MLYKAHYCIYGELEHILSYVLILMQTPLVSKENWTYWKEDKKYEVFFLTHKYADEKVGVVEKWGSHRTFCGRADGSANLVHNYFCFIKRGEEESY